MKKYRTKPAVIEAIEWDQTFETLEKLKRVPGFNAVVMAYDTSPSRKIVTGLRIKTIEGTMNARDGDFIVKGLIGEFYPCKPEAFHKKYEVIEEAAKT